MTQTTSPADPARLGAHVRDGGTDFAVYSSAAAYGGSVTLCLLDDAGAERQVPMWVEQDIWTCAVPGVGPGQRYGYRASGPRDASRGLAFDPATLLVDPYAYALPPADPTSPRRLHSVVVDPAFDWGGDHPLRRSWAETVLDGTHVRGLTQAHPEVPPELRGTFDDLRR